MKNHCSLSRMSLSLILRPTVGRPVCLGIMRLSWAYDQNFITVRQLRVCWCGWISLTRGGICRLQLLSALASAVIVGLGSRGTSDHILLSQIRDLSFRRFLRLAGSRWRYSTPPPHGASSDFITSGRTEYKSPGLTDILFSSVYSLQWECPYRTFDQQWTSASVRCCGNMCLASRWLVVDFRSGSTVPTFRHHVTIFTIIKITGRYTVWVTQSVFK
jgi:hypothetical protein